jgi:hypothetical protein
VAPVERALMSYCSDVLNLQALHGGDRSTAPRTKLANARTRLAEISTPAGAADRHDVGRR